MGSVVVFSFASASGHVACKYNVCYLTQVDFCHYFISDLTAVASELKVYVEQLKTKAHAVEKSSAEKRKTSSSSYGTASVSSSEQEPCETLSCTGNQKSHTTDSDTADLVLVAQGSSGTTSCEKSEETCSKGVLEINSASDNVVSFHTFSTYLLQCPCFIMHSNIFLFYLI